MRCKNCKHKIKTENIYTILEEIEYEKSIERAKHLIKIGRFMPDQFIFSIIQEFYSNVLDNIEDQEQ